MSIVLLGSTSGSCTLQEQAVAGTTVLTLPTTSGTILTTATPFSNGQGPTFSAYQSSSQTYSNATYNKVALQSEDWDTANCFDTSTYRFTPNVAGYYQFSMSYLPASASRGSEIQVMVYKNGALSKSGTDIIATSTIVLNGSALLYANGTTDYFEFYAYTGVGGTATGDTKNTFFQAFLARTA